MQVFIKDFSVNMEIKNKGIEIDVCDNEGRHLGDLVVTKSKVVWCRGRTTPENGKKLAWSDFIARMEELP